MGALTKRTKTRRTRGVLGGRSERVVEQVIEAAIAELAASGYRAFRMDRVSSAARVNKTTIYRRWSNKALLVGAAFDQMSKRLDDAPLPDSGSLERDLVDAFRYKTTFHRGVEGRAWSRLLAEQHDPEVRAIIGDAVKTRSHEWHTMVTRGIARGELPAGTDARLLLGMLGAIVNAWNASAPGGLSSTLLEAAVRTIVAGARAGSLTRIQSKRKRLGLVRASQRGRVDPEGLRSSRRRKGELR